MDEVVVRCSTDGRIVHASSEVCRITGRTLPQLRGTSLQDVLAVCGVDASLLRLEELTENRPFSEHETDCLLADGRVHRMRWILVAQFTAGGDLEGYVSIGRVAERSPAGDHVRQELEGPEPLSLDGVLHRVKNSMAIISSMAGLQCETSRSLEVIESLATVRGRIRAVALAHEKRFLSPDGRRIALGRYAAEVARATRHILLAHAPRSRLQTLLEDVEAPVERAVPCGLILHELASNSLKHGFPDERSGTVVVELASPAPGTAEILVSHDGVACAGDPRQAEDGGLGLQLVELLAQQLGGEAEFRWQPEVRTSVRFPVE